MGGRYVDKNGYFLYNLVNIKTVNGVRAIINLPFYICVAHDRTIQIGVCGDTVILLLNEQKVGGCKNEAN